jgi:hypothetical protein
MYAMKDLKLDDVMDDLRAQATKRIDELFKQGRKQARKAGGGPDDTALFSAFTVGIVAGAIAGAAIALLITPFSGTQARAKLSEKVDKIRSDSKPVWDAAASRLEHGSGNGKPVGSYEPDYSSPKPVS